MLASLLLNYPTGFIPPSVKAKRTKPLRPEKWIVEEYDAGLSLEENIERNVEAFLQQQEEAETPDQAKRQRQEIEALLLTMFTFDD